MTFTSKIKIELIEKEFSEEQAYDFLRGVIASAGIEKNELTIIKILNKKIVKNIIEILEGLKIEYQYLNDNNVFIQIKTFSKNKKVKHPNYFLGGVFLGGGSASDHNSTSYHLELQFHSNENAKKLLKLLNLYGFKFNLIKRRNKSILYIKKQTEITDFLISILAKRAAILFEESRIQRDMYNAINRYSNLDIYNQSKLAKASSIFIELWEYIKENNLYHEFKQKEIDFFILREKNQFSSLNELALKYNKNYKTKKTRAGLNHWIYKLKKIVKNNRQGE